MFCEQCALEDQHTSHKKLTYKDMLKIINDKENQIKESNTHIDKKVYRGLKMVEEEEH